jgi:hypothetical protein
VPSHERFSSNEGGLLNTPLLEDGALRTVRALARAVSLLTSNHPRSPTTWSRYLPYSM